MKTTIFQSDDHFVITFVGIPAILFLIALIALSFMLMNTLEPENAEHRVRMILMRDVSQHHMAELTKTGLKLPDDRMANRWLEESTKIKNLKFLSLSLKNPILDIFSPDTPTFVVRAVIQDEKQHKQTRFFWLSWAGIDREISKTAWLFSI